MKEVPATFEISSASLVFRDSINDAGNDIKSKERQLPVMVYFYDFWMFNYFIRAA